MLSVKRIIKDWTLPVSMTIGALAYLLFTQVSALHGMKLMLAELIPYILPWLIVVILFFTYSKIEPREFMPRRWHLWLIIIQLVETILLVGICILLSRQLLAENNGVDWRIIAESLLAVCIAPMAAVGAVVTQKIGGNPATATTYTLISSTFTAIMVPLVYPLVEPGLELTFMDLCLKILSRVFPTIMAPLAVALLLWRYAPKVKTWVAEKSKDYSFYIWGICTMVNTAQIIRSIVSSAESVLMVVWICILVGILVGAQFAIGKTIGSVYDDRKAAGQGLAQKNTVLAIWMAMSFLHPVAVIGPGVCLLWQNVVNSWQIWHYGRQKRD